MNHRPDGCEIIIARKRKDDDKNNVDPDQLCFNTNSVGVPTIKDGLGRSVEPETIVVPERSKMSIALPDFVEFTDEELAEIEEMADLPGQTYHSVEEKLGLVDNRSAEFYKNSGVFENRTLTQDQRDAKVALEALKYYSNACVTNAQLDCVINGHPMAPAFAGIGIEQLERNVESQLEAGNRRIRKIIGSNVLKIIGFDIDAVDENGNRLFKSEEAIIGSIYDKYYPGITSKEIKSERAKLRYKLKKIENPKPAK